MANMGRFVLALCIVMAGKSYAVSDTGLMRQGIWRDAKTGLYWDRCSIGQTWNGSTCTGKPMELSLEQAQQHIAMMNQEAKGGFRNWRLPTIDELVSIRHCSAGYLMNNYRMILMSINADGSKNPNPQSCAYESQSPTINSNIFPNTKSANYWSSSDFLGGQSGNQEYKDYMRTMSFKDGAFVLSYKDNYLDIYVRAVHSD